MDTIVACSSGTLTNSAIGLIRISGINFLERISHLLSIKIENIKPRYSHFCKFQSNGMTIDEIVLVFYKGPNSYNGEDILELSVHGNQLNIERIIGLICETEGFRRAKPGEFTLRALNNKKLTLNQVEGLDLLLNANNIFSLDQGFSLLSGKLKDSFLNLYDQFLKHRSSVEFGFDFLEDIGEERFKEQLNESFVDFKDSILKLHKQVSNQGFNLLKPEIVLYGLPNAGKSTLFNNLLGEERAITSNIAGTTRDFIREDIYLENNIFSLIDTAGIRTSSDQIEEIGVEKAIKLTKNAFFKILVINPFEFDKDFYTAIEDVSFDLVVFSNNDREGFKEEIKKFDWLFGPIEPKTGGPIEPETGGPIEPENDGPIEPKNDGPIEPKNGGPIEPGNGGPIEPISLNLLDFDGERGKLIVDEVVFKYLKLLSFDPILINRHSESIKNIYTSLSQYESVFGAEDDMAIIASELNILGHCISELIGIVSPDDVLQNIFENFCIGK